MAKMETEANGRQTAVQRLEIGLDGIFFQI
jgi:hypothetical protein